MSTGTSILKTIRKQHTVAVEEGLESIKQFRLQQAADIICKAIKEKMHVVTLTGFDGGKSKELADEYLHGINLHVECPEYEAAEDCHQAIMHMIAKYIRQTMWK